jgi:hypothetical protein
VSAHAVNARRRAGKTIVELLEKGRRMARLGKKGRSVQHRRLRRAAET